ncbi:hypothetical protein [Alteromonas oceanisediminis]|uniref:hypothetical protein n=1 Tax=Alteromonas oceanisediminis TaxID=2836180 RepID=UPI001BD93836|nr:hypothetical protein [Alteromonas oceanisediminis]MBT0587477.1 hypothetical protein [Alteromonas oceanisediminis]
MSNDLLFSVMPRRGTVPIKGDRGEVKKVDKKTPMHPSPSDENHPKVERRLEKKGDDSRQNESSKGDEQPDTPDFTDQHVGLIVDTTDDESQRMEKATANSNDEYPNGEIDDEDEKGGNLDVTI